ncbi:hypothetical protein Tco_1152546 [Tanacetum coccineum]
MRTNDRGFILCFVTWRLKRAKDQKISRLGVKRAETAARRGKKRRNDVRLNEKTVEKVTRRNRERGECREKEEAEQKKQRALQKHTSVKVRSE